MSERIFVLCIRVEDSDSDCVVDTAKKVVCAACHKDVWLAPSTIETCRDRGFQIEALDPICYHCIPERDLMMERPGPKQVADIKAHLLSRKKK